MKILILCCLFLINASISFSDDLFDILSIKFAYDFNEMTPMGFMSLAKGDGAGGAMERWESDYYEIDIIFRGLKERNRYEILLFFMMDQKHEKFYLDSINVEFEGKSVNLVEDRRYSFPQYILDVRESRKAMGPVFLTNGELYWTRLEFLQPTDNNMDFPHAHFKRVFRGKKDGEIFPCRLVIKYRMDDGPQKEISYSYNVEVQKW